MFFDDYRMFADPEKTAASSRRLNLRHLAMIESNRDILEGARVLDLASHDGRWSFAALQAGATHVTGVEARESLVESADKIFANYGVPRDQYRFVAGDMFDVLEHHKFEVDVVMCLGFVYHTLRYGELFSAIRRIQPQHLILDTKVITGDEPVVRLKVNRTFVQANAAKDLMSYHNRALAGIPSLPALKIILEMYDIDVEQEYDWPALLAEHKRGLSGYSTGERVTLRCRLKPRARRKGGARTAERAVPAQRAQRVGKEPLAMVRTAVQRHRFA